MESMHDILVQANWRGTFPAFTFIHLLAPDNMGHMYGPGDDEYREAIYHEDKHIGRLMRTLEQEGLADKVWVALTADHGMKAVEKNQSLDLHKFISHRMNIRCAYEAVEEGTPRPWREAWFRRFRAVETTSGARCCFIYLSNPDNVPQGMGEWTKRPSLESLRKFRTDTDETIDVIAALREQPGVGFICARDAKGDCHVYSSDGHAVIRAKGDGRDAPPGRLYQYTIEEGRDPLGYDLIPKSKVANPKSKDEWFAATCDSEYPNFVPEVYDLFDSPRTGDLVLFAAPGWTFKAGQKGAHGGPHRDELRIPILITGPGIRHGEKIPRARSVDLVPTFLEHMGIKTDAKFDGRSLLEQITLNRPGNHKEVKMRDKR
jgi:arylsulfatase A-like enzyme